MYQPGLDNGLARIRYAEVLEEAAYARADRKARSAGPNVVARRLVLALSAAVPLAICVIWLWVAH